MVVNYCDHFILLYLSYESCSNLTKTQKFGLEIVPLLINLIQSPDNAPALKKAALSCMSLLIQCHTDNQNFLLDRDVDDILVRIMATGGVTNEPVLQMWATYW